VLAAPAHHGENQVAWRITYGSSSAVTSSSVSSRSTAAAASTKWCCLVTPTMGAATTGFFSTHASPTWAIDTPRASAIRWIASMMAWSLSSHRGRPKRSVPLAPGWWSGRPMAG
jgi:hypothetical protein